MCISVASREMFLMRYRNHIAFQNIYQKRGQLKKKKTPNLQFYPQPTGRGIRSYAIWAILERRCALSHKSSKV